MTDGPSPIVAAADTDRACERFEAAWRAGAVPSIDDFLPVGSNRREVLLDLIRIDLEQRWRRHGGGGTADTVPLLEEYRQRFPELGDLPDELIGEEYLVRHWLGDCPGHDEYERRFPGREARLRAVLAGVHAELASEFAGSRHYRSNRRSASLSPSDRPSLAIPSAALTAPEMREDLERYALLTGDQLAELALREREGQFADPQALHDELVRRDWLTPFQVERVQAGRAAELLVGPYVLRKPLGEGGAGQVFQATHKAMNRTVALKILRRDLLTDREVVERFYREIRLAGQLSHPNIVQAFDAGPIGELHCLVMEFIDGEDLARRVRRDGPLLVDQACDYVCQTARGLQHAHEHGLVHRDIKPPNLMVVAGGKGLVASEDKIAPALSLATSHQPLATVKILDLGLARLRKLEKRDGAFVTEGMTSLVTPMGSVMMGTPDFMAPEQALDFHAADVRADIYSLGCTFYYLLTGQPPFPGGTLAQKLLRHQQAEALPISHFRGDVPAHVELILRRMLAKAPEQRFQTPADVVAAFVSRESPSSAPAAPAQLPIAEAIPASLLGDTSTTQIVAGSAPRRRRHLRIGLALGAAVLLFVSVIGALALASRPSATERKTAQANSKKAPAPTTPAREPGLLFADHFTNGKLGPWRLPTVNRWKVVPDRAGTGYVLTGGTFAQPGTDQTDRRGFIALQCGDDSWKDYAIEASVRFDAETAPDSRFYGVLLMGRVQPNLDCYWLEYGVHGRSTGADGAGSMILIRCANAGSEILQETRGIPKVQRGAWVRLKLELQGDSLRCKIDDVTYIEKQDARFQHGGAAITLSNVSRAAGPIDWKHVRVTELPRQTK
jgi:serine/threonine-protein kinase